jgi:DNA-binding transcriptional LysR family regulator
LLHELQDLLVPTAHPLARRHDGAELAEAAGEAWIAASDRLDQYRLLQVSCAAAGFTPRVTQQAKEWVAISALVAAGFGVCLIPRLVPLPPDHAVVRVPLRGDTIPSRRIITCTRRGSDRRPVIARGLDALRSAAAERGDKGPAYGAGRTGWCSRAETGSVVSEV